MKDICIFGTGGNAREIYNLALQCGREVIAFISKEELKSIYGVPVKDISFFDINSHEAIIAIGDSKIRRKIIEKEISKDFVFASLIHPTVLIGKNVSIGKGVTINAYSVLPCDIYIGDFCQLDFFTRVGHDSIFRNYVTTAAGVMISGGNLIGENVFLGTNSSTKENISIVSDTIIGAAAFVSKNINVSGTYVGVPAKVI